MPFLDDLQLELDADRVLWGQGADPAVIRRRRPALIGLAERAIEEGRPLLRPAVLYRELAVREFRHQRLELDEGGYLSGPLINEQLSAAQKVIVAVCTVGDALDACASQRFADDPVAALALAGVGAAAAQSLAESICQHFEARAAQEGSKTSLPLNPGMAGWPLREAQEQVFALLDARQIGVTLAPSGIMVPLKSLSLVIGVGEHLSSSGSSCDFCSMRETCRYQNRHPGSGTS